jgi:hypothetical protein
VAVLVGVDIEVAVGERAGVVVVGDGVNEALKVGRFVSTGDGDREGDDVREGEGETEGVAVLVEMLASVI